MTDKQEKILNAALELFAKDGFKGTSTNKIAKRANVSEGLIFRHFKSKDGLLEAILKQGEEKIKMVFSDIVFETDPRELIRKTILMGLKMIQNQADADFWKLQYKIKWEVEVYGEHKIEPLETALTGAFKKLNFEKPELEARLLLITTDGFATRFYLQENFNYEEMLNYMLKKYQV
jgi:AcrR family transcriptional regulator